MFILFKKALLLPITFIPFIPLIQCENIDINQRILVHQWLSLLFNQTLLSRLI